MSTLRGRGALVSDMVFDQRVARARAPTRCNVGGPRARADFFDESARADQIETESASKRSPSAGQNLAGTAGVTVRTCRCAGEDFCRAECSPQGPLGRDFS